MLQQDFTKSQHTPSEVNQLLALARNSISSITTKTLAQHWMRIQQDNWGTISSMSSWSNARSQPSLNWGLRITSVWKHIQNGLSAGQLSFSLRAKSDTLPTPLNLWKLRIVPKCHLWNSPWPTIQHILNGCPVTLSQGRYTWQHDFRQWSNEAAPTTKKLYADLPGLRVTENWLSTARILNTSACPDVDPRKLNSLSCITLPTACIMQGF